MSTKNHPIHLRHLDWSQVAIKLVLMTAIMMCHPQQHFPAMMPPISLQHLATFGDASIANPIIIMTHNGNLSYHNMP